MTAPLVLGIAGYSLLVAVLAAVVAARRVPRPRWLQAAAWMLQVLLLAQAGLAGLAILTGRGPAEPALFLAYLAVAVVLLPVCGAMSAGDRVRTGPDVRLAMATVAGLVVQWRLVATWRTGG
ncbi:hypothetical protein [Nakamurella sp.]|uniref:hypothetical protein n=1 Tax=Nakamurella sp. TaxID=1869182 RepID=UPI0037844970